MVLLQKKDVENINEVIIGVEIELLILNKDYYVVNRANELIKNFRRKGLGVSEECSQSMIEFNTSPVKVSELAKTLKDNLKKINKAAEELGLKALPFPIILGSGFKSKTTKRPKYLIKKRVLGEKRFNICKEISGIHFHFDLAEKKSDIIKQLNILNLLDPLIIAISSCSQQKRAGDFIHNTRLKRYRYVAYEKYPFQGNVQGVFKSYEDYERDLESNYKKFITENRQRGIDFSRYCNKYDAIWGPVRINNIFNTVEVRTLDSNPDINLIIDMADFITDCLGKAVADNNFIDKISKKATSLQKNQSGYPLQYLSKEAIYSGLSSEVIKEYVEFIIKKVGKKHLRLLNERKQFYSSYKEVEEVYHKSIRE